MLIVLLAFLGVPRWLIVGWLAAGLWHRHKINQLPGIFKVKVRLISGSYRHVKEKFSRMTSHAIMAHDVLIIETGLLVPRILHFKITKVEKEPQPADPNQIKGLGDKPVTIQYRLDEGAVIEIAVPNESESGVKCSIDFNRL